MDTRLDASRARLNHLAARLQAIGHGMLRYGLVTILLLIGTAKWTAAEAEAIRPWVASSPFLSWLYSVMSVQGASQVIGIFEIITAALIAARPWRPAWAICGGIAAIGMFLVTLSFLFTTPRQSPDAQGFLLKDFFLLGVAVWLTGEAMEAQARLPQVAERSQRPVSVEN